jgi:Zn-dependent peptidase ImmA (M78 family)
MVQWSYPIAGYADGETGGIYIRADQPTSDMLLVVAHELMHLKQHQRLGMGGIPRFCWIRLSEKQRLLRRRPGTT